MPEDDSGSRPDPLFIMDVRDGVLWILWAHGTSVSDADAQAVAERTDALSVGVRLPMLVELNCMQTVTRKALFHFAKELNVSAMALVGPSPVDKVIADHFTEVHHPPYPTRYFPCRDEALTWVSSYSHAT